ncbi:MAG: amino acid transporter [Cellulomonas sp.]
MDADEVHRVLDALAAAGCRAWVAGGWGVDALAGRQTRPHRDLDLAVDATGEGAALAALARLGYAVETDWRPVRVELAAPGSGWVDLHPVAFDGTGRGIQAGLDGTTFDYPPGCLVTGTIGARTVGCLSVAQQVAFHTGYPPRDVDRADLAVLGRLPRGGAAL